MSKFIGVATSRHEHRVVSYVLGLVDASDLRGAIVQIRDEATKAGLEVTDMHHMLRTEHSSIFAVEAKPLNRSEFDSILRSEAKTREYDSVPIEKVLAGGA